MSRKVYLSALETLEINDVFDSEDILARDKKNSEKLNSHLKKINEQIIEYAQQRGHSVEQMQYYLGSEYSVCNSVHAFDMKSVCFGALAVNPSHFPDTVLNAPVCHLSIDAGICSAVNTVLSGRISSLVALGMAFEEIRYGEREYAVAGGYDEVGAIQSVLSFGNDDLCGAVALCLLESRPHHSSWGEILEYAVVGMNGKEISVCTHLISVCTNELQNDGKKVEILLNYIECSDSIAFAQELKRRFSCVEKVHIMERDYMGCNDIMHLSRYCEKKVQNAKYILILGVEFHQAAALLLQVNARKCAHNV